MIRQAWEWWSEGLAAAFLQLERALSQPRRFRLDSRHQPFMLQPLETAGQPIEISERPGAPQDDVLQQTRGSAIEILVPPEAILEGRVDPLPAESRPYVESVVLHQIGKLFPWRAEDVLYAVSIGDRDDGKLDVLVHATPRQPIASLLGSIKAYEPSELYLVADADEHAEKPARIPVRIEGEGQDRLERVRYVTRYAVVAVLLGMVLTVGWTSFTYSSLSDDLAAVETAIATREALARRGSDAKNIGRNDLQSRKEQTPAIVAVLDVLSVILPDDTYLTDMTLEAGRLRISGISGRATELVPLLENSGRFKNASFYAPTTRVQGRAGDRFSIEASVIP